MIQNARNFHLNWLQIHRKSNSHFFILHISILALWTLYDINDILKDSSYLIRTILNSTYATISKLIKLDISKIDELNQSSPSSLHITKMTPYISSLHTILPLLFWSLSRNPNSRFYLISTSLLPLFPTTIPPWPPKSLTLWHSTLQFYL